MASSSSGARPPAQGGDVLSQLRTYFGSENIVDVFENTAFAAPGSQYGFGLYIVSGVLDDAVLQERGRSLRQAFDDIQMEYGTNATAIKGKGKPRHYASIQTTADCCSCKYEYAGVSRHKVWRTETVAGLKEIDTWLQQSVGVPWRCCNEVVANWYRAADREAIPWHTDASELYDEHNEVLSLSMGAKGIFCIQPQSRDSNRWQHEAGWYKKEATRRQHWIQLQLRMAVPVLPGDLMVMWGRFQTFCVHKTIHAPELDAVGVSNVILPKYSSRNEWLRLRWSQWLGQPPRGDRLCITWRNITHHLNTPERRCPMALLEPSRGDAPPRADPPLAGGRGDAPPRADPLPPPPPPPPPMPEREPSGGPVPESPPPPVTEPHLEHVDVDETKKYLREVDDFLRYASVLMSEYEEKLKQVDNAETSARLEAGMKQLADLKHFHASRQVVAEMTVDLAAKLEAIRTWRGRRSTFMVLQTPDDNSKERKRGLMGSGPSRAARVIITLRTFCKLLENAEAGGWLLGNFTGTPAAMDCQDEPLLQIGPSGAKLESVSSFLRQRKMATKCWELQLDWTKSMERVFLQPTTDAGKQKKPRGEPDQETMSREVGKMWIDLMVMEKKRQLQQLHEVSATLPWTVASWEDMPVTVWLKTTVQEHTEKEADQ